jgi:hypothetical protein
MSEKETSGPVHPVRDAATWQAHGISLREYAAIKLRVPDSGIDWLDDMIRKSQRDEFAAKAMQAFISAYPCQAIDREDGGIPADSESIADDAYDVADAMLRTREAS